MGLEEAGVNQATVWPESGADRTASSRENPVPSTAPAKAFERTEGFFILLTKNRSAWDLKKPE